MSALARPINRNLLNFAVDGAVFVAFLATTAPQLTGLAIHEWLSLALGAALVAHLLLHWAWIVGVGRRLLGKSGWRPRLNYLLNALLFVAFTAVIASGVLISQAALPLFGLTMAHDRGLTQLHHQASDLTVLLLGLHVALHWSWIVGVARRLVRWPTRVAARVEEVAR